MTFITPRLPKHRPHGGWAEDVHHRGEHFAPEGIRLKGGLVSGEHGKMRGDV